MFINSAHGNWYSVFLYEHIARPHPSQVMRYVHAVGPLFTKRNLTFCHQISRSWQAVKLWGKSSWNLVGALVALPSILQWRHDEGSGVSNHQPHDCLLNRLFNGQIKENIKAPSHWPLWGEFTYDRWIPRTKGQSPVNTPNNGPVTRKMF